MSHRLDSRYAEADSDVSVLHAAVEQLSAQLDNCLSLWEDYAAGSESLSTRLTDLEEQARTHFKLQATQEDKEKQVTSAHVSYLLICYLD